MMQASNTMEQRIGRRSNTETRTNRLPTDIVEGVVYTSAGPYFHRPTLCHQSS